MTSALRAALHPTAPPPPTPPASGPATRAALTPAKPRNPINRALVHVQVGNTEARQFYERLGFKESGTYVAVAQLWTDPRDETYYSRMEPRAAWILTLDDIAASLGESAPANGK